MLLFSCQVVPDSSQPQGLQHARLPCPSPSPGVCPSSYPLNWWRHPTISSSVAPFSSCLQSFPVSWLFTPGGQSIGTSASASVLPVSIQGWFPLGLTDLISLLSKRLSRVFSNITVQKHQFSALGLLYGTTLTSIHDYWKTIALIIQTFVGNWCLCFLIHCLDLS